MTANEIIDRVPPVLRAGSEGTRDDSFGFGLMMNGRPSDRIPPYPENPCGSCQFRTVRTGLELSEGRIMMRNIPFCIEKSIDIGDRRGPCSRYREEFL